MSDLTPTDEREALTAIDLDAIRARDARYPAGPISNDIGSPIMAAQDRRDLLAEIDRLLALVPDHLALLARQRELGWPDMHPEDICHRCGRPNMTWATTPDVWNPIMRPDGPDSPWLWNEIICPQCFAELFEARFPATAWMIAPDEQTRGARAFRDSFPALVSEPPTGDEREELIYADGEYGGVEIENYDTGLWVTIDEHPRYWIGPRALKALLAALTPEAGS